MPPRSVSAAPLRSPSRASAGRRHHGPMRHHLLQDRARLPQPHLLGELAGSPGRGRPLCGAWGPGGRGEPAEGSPGPCGLGALGGVLPGPDGGQGGADRRSGGVPPSGLLARCQVTRVPATRACGELCARGLSLSGRQARNGTLPSESGPLSLSESWQSQWLSPGHVAATWGTRVESWARNFDFQLFV